MKPKIKFIKKAWVICIETMCQGTVISTFDIDDNGKRYPALYDTERDAQLEVLDNIDTRIDLVNNGDMDYEDFDTNEFPLEVDVMSDGSLHFEFGVWDGNPNGQIE